MQQKSSRGVRQYEVDAAADALLAEGQRPTVERVRMKMGRGSPNTVAPMLEVWFAGLAPRLGVASGGQGQPPGVPPAIRQGMEQLWESARSLALEAAQGALAGDRDALARDREALDAQRADVNAQLAGAKDHVNALQQSLEQARRQLDEGAERLRHASTLLAERERDLAESRASIAKLVEHKDAAAREHARQVDRLEAAREKATERSAANERRMLEDLDRVRQDLKATQKRATDLESRLGARQVENTRLRETAAATVHDLQLERARLLERLAGKDAAPRPRARQRATAKEVTGGRTTKRARKRP